MLELLVDQGLRLLRVFGLLLYPLMREGLEPCPPHLGIGDMTKVMPIVWALLPIILMDYIPMKLLPGPFVLEDRSIGNGSVTSLSSFVMYSSIILCTLLPDNVMSRKCLLHVHIIRALVSEKECRKFVSLLMHVLRRV